MQKQPTQELKFDIDLRRKIEEGVNIVAKAVKMTLGPEGRNVMMKNDRFQTPTKDGVTVARAINLKDQYQSIGAEAVKEAASNTNDEGGDGTTVTIALDQALINGGFSAINSGISPIAIVKGMKKALGFVNDYLEKMATPIKKYEDIKNVASISANDKEMGEHIANLFKKIGKEGVLVVEESKSVGYEEEYVKGMRWDQGFASPYMMTDVVRRKAEIDDPVILLTDYAIEESEEIIAYLTALARKGIKKFVVVSNNVTGQGLEAMVTNNKNIMLPNGTTGKFATLAVRAPYASTSMLEALEDMAALTSGIVISKSKGMVLPKKADDVDLKALGSADKIISSLGVTVIINNKVSKRKVSERIKRIKEDLKTEDRDWERTKLKERLGRLTGGVAILRFGGENESIAKEMKYRIEDASNATRNALEEGIVPGGEVAILRASKDLESRLKEFPGDESIGAGILVQALKQPIKILVDNAGFSGNEVMKKVLEGKKNFGFDASTGEYGDLIKLGIIDPKKVVKSAVNNAVATASMLLTLNVAIVDEDQPEPEQKNK